MPLSKSSFKKYLQCPSYFWFAQNQPEVLAATELNEFAMMLAEQGRKVEQHFYKLFPELQIVTSKGAAAVEETQSMVHRGATHLAQAAFEADGYFAQSDLVIFKDNKHIDIYEIKSSSSMQNTGVEDAAPIPTKEEHLYDLAFQYQVATKAGYIVDQLYLVELNKKYSASGQLDLNTLFAIHKVMEEVELLADGVGSFMETAKVSASFPLQPSTCECRYLPRKKQCPAFGHMHPHLMEYNVYDLAISRSPKRLKEFVDASIFRIEDIPHGTKMTDSYRDQVITWNENREIILADDINHVLNTLIYPLYFLDYETTASAIPQFDNTRSYQQIPFQYSLHIIEELNGEVIHVDYLHHDRIAPMASIVDHLRKDIGDKGTIIVWNKTFETKCNENLAELVPSSATFLRDVNRRMFDLMEVFSKHLYVHKDFKGSYSIKKVLPVLVPELSYANLTISDGGTATSQWAKMVFDITDEEEKKIISQQLLEYCKLDTLAMVEIYNCIYKKCNGVA